APRNSNRIQFLRVVPPRHAAQCASLRICSQACLATDKLPIIASRGARLHPTGRPTSSHCVQEPTPMISRNTPPTTRRTRRDVLVRLGAAVGWLASGRLHAQPAARVKDAGGYTVHIGQQWVSRVHRALVLASTSGEIDYVFSENDPDDTYEQVLRRYADGGAQPIVGEAFRAA